MKTKYSNKDRMFINRAWDTIMGLLDNDSTLLNKMEIALKYERRHRSSVYAAKAVLVRCFYPTEENGGMYKKRPACPTDWAHCTEGCMISCVVGNFVANKIGWDEADAFIRAIASHDDAILRTLRGIR
mgnify:CR=1 FL=1